MNSRELNNLHDLLMDFQNSVLEGDMGSDDDTVISQAIDIVEQYL